MSTAQHEKAATPQRVERDASGPPPGAPRRPARVLTLIAAAAAVAVLVCASALLHLAWPGPSPADAPRPEPHLPTRVNTPGAWSDDENPKGPWAALGVAVRSTPRGLREERQRLQLFAVSGVDGRSAWVSPPGVNGLDDRSLVGWFALSPDGRWIAWSREDRPRRPGSGPHLLGWAVMNTVTGDVREFHDPRSHLLRDEIADLTFSGDSRYLLTSYELPGAPRNRGHQFVAWDVRDGARTVLERPGHYWLPDPGSAASGVVWSRGHTVFRDDPPTGDRRSYVLPRSVVAASWGPDDRAFAYIGHDKGRKDTLLYAGPSLTAARNHALRLDVAPDQLLGWRDHRHVVVGHYREDVRVVDVVSGHVRRIVTAGYGEPLNAPLLAGDLWRNPLRSPPAPTGTSDPRTPYLWSAGALAVVLAAAALARRRRTRRNA